MNTLHKSWLAGCVALASAAVAVLSLGACPADEMVLRTTLVTPELPVRFSGSTPEDLKRLVSRDALRRAVRNAEAAGPGEDYRDRIRSALAAAVMGRRARATTLLEERLKDRPNDPDCLSDLAALRLTAGAEDPWQIVLALEETGRALEVAPGHAAARHNRALALEQAGLILRAREAWRSLEEEQQTPGPPCLDSDALDSMRSSPQLRSPPQCHGWRMSRLGVPRYGMIQARRSKMPPSASCLCCFLARWTVGAAAVCRSRSCGRW